MAHRSFGAVRLAPPRDPITFDLGLYGEDRFTVVPEPSLGDCFDLYDAPEPTPTNMLESARILARFVRRMVDPADQPRFDAALRRIPSTEAHVIVEAATWIAEQVTGFPTTPPGGSSAGRQPTGNSSRRKSGGRPHSKG
jgi:hypothetical protein